MRILVPWKAVVLVWGLLSALIFFGLVASSVLQGKDTFAPGAIIAQPPAMNAGATHAGSNKLLEPPEVLLLLNTGLRLNSVANESESLLAAKGGLLNRLTEVCF